LGTTRYWGFNYLIDQAVPPQQKVLSDIILNRF